MLQRFFEGVGAEPCAREENWWPVEQGVTRNQLEWAVWHWVKANEQPMVTYRLEDISAGKPDICHGFCSWFDIQFTAQVAEIFSQPINTIREERPRLTAEQLDVFWNFPGVKPLMKQYDYKEGDDYGTLYR